MFKLQQILVALVLTISGCADSDTEAPVVNRSGIERITASHYRVQRGDTLYSIAWASTLDYRQIAQANHLKPPYALHPGDVLRINQLSLPKAQFRRLATSKPIQLDAPRFASLEAPLKQKKSSVKSMPNMGNITHQSSDRLQLPTPGAARISAPPSNGINSQKHTPIYDSQYADNEIDEQDRRKDLIFTKKSVHSWMWPVRGSIVGQFSSGQLGNKGLDITGQYGQPIKASESGVVVYSGSGLRGYGNLIIIKHNASFLSAYAHNSELAVTEGMQVKAGQEIAFMGRAPSGQVMLHFEIRRDGKPVNPLQYLR